MQKKCAKCQKTFPALNFRKKADGNPISYCIDCQDAYARAYNKARRERLTTLKVEPKKQPKTSCLECQKRKKQEYRKSRYVSRRPKAPEGHKICSRCKEALPVRLFRATKMGLESKCRSCDSIYRQERREKNTLTQASQPSRESS